MVEPADLRLVQLHPAEFLGLVAADRADAVDGLLAVAERPGPERLEGRLGGGDGGVGRRVDAERARRPRRRRAVAVRRPGRPSGRGPAGPRCGSGLRSFAWRVTVARGLVSDRPGQASLGQRRAGRGSRRSVLPPTSTRVDQADHHGVDRQLLGLGGEPGARPLADQHHLVEPRAEGVDDDERPAGRDQAVARPSRRPGRARRSGACARSSTRPSGSPPGCRSPWPRTWEGLPSDLNRSSSGPSGAGRAPAGRRRAPRWSGRSRPGPASRRPRPCARRGPAALRAGSSAMPNQSRSRQTPVADPDRVLADPAGEDDRVGPAELDEVGAEVVAGRGDEDVERQRGLGVAGLGRGLDVAEVAARAADPFEARLVGQGVEHLFERSGRSRGG